MPSRSPRLYEDSTPRGCEECWSPNGTIRRPCGHGTEGAEARDLLLDPRVQNITTFSIQVASRSSFACQIISQCFLSFLDTSLKHLLLDRHYPATHRLDPPIRNRSHPTILPVLSIMAGTPPTYKHFLVTYPSEYVAHVEINRPEKLNAFFEA
jgi:hypothetical protein